MAIVDNNPLLSKISGMLGDTVVFRMWRGRMLMSNRPKKREKLSDKQKVTVDRFKLAARYAVTQMKDPAAKLDYGKGTNFQKHSAYLVALCDHMNPPKVHYIKADDYTGAVGETIAIKATDDFKVVRVKVSITDSDGVVLEQGDAVATVRKPWIWKYQTTVLNTMAKGTMIRATAYDKPGNRDSAEVVL